MQRIASAPAEAGQQAGRAARQASPWLERLGRMGFAAKGIVYLVIGLLAIQAAVGSGGGTTDSQGALEQILLAPFGQTLLGVIAVGLLGYALWRVVQAGFDTERKGTDPPGLLARAGYLGSAAVYLALAATAVRLAFDAAAAKGGSTTQQDVTALAFAVPFGAWLVAVGGAIMIGVGVAQLVSAIRAKFRDHLQLAEMSAAEQTWACRLGRLGYAARGVVFGIVGLFLIFAAVETDPQQATGLGGALASLAERPFGPWLLGGVAAGLLAYGVYMFVEARYRRMVVPAP
jgi:hypothetical protein